MEASVAANGAQGGEAQQGEAAQQGVVGIDGAQLTQTLEVLAGGQEELRQLLQSQSQQQEAGQQEQESDDFDLAQFLDLDSPTFDPNAVATSITELVNRAAEQQTQSVIQPLAQKLEQMETQRAEDKRVAEAHALVEEFPELGQPEVAQEVVQTARAYAETNFPPEVSKVLGDSPAFWRAIYMAGRAAEAAQAEGGDVQTAMLEGGSGARPGADPSSMDQLGDLIVSGGRASGGRLPFG